VQILTITHGTLAEGNFCDTHGKTQELFTADDYSQLQWQQGQNG